MSFQIHITEEALEEEAEEFIFYEGERLGLGDQFINDVEATLTKISEHPTHYSFIDDTKTLRDVSLKTFPYVIIFEVRGQSIVVYHIHHTSKSK